MAKRKTVSQLPEGLSTAGDSHGASSKFGQMIGDAFAECVLTFIGQYLLEKFPAYVLLQADEGKALVRLEMLGGTFRQMDNVIALKNSTDPIALLESKWLKDARHHNDKGAWILQLREVRKKHPTVRGAVAILAGYWTEGVGVMFKTEGSVEMVLVAKDDEIYGSLQEPVNEYMRAHQFDEFTFDVRAIRSRLPRPNDLSRCLIDLKASGQLSTIAKTWLQFPRTILQSGKPLVGSDLIIAAIETLLQPLPDNPRTKRFEIALQIDTGNTIYREFDDPEQALDFIQRYSNNPKAILELIRPKITDPNPSEKA